MGLLVLDLATDVEGGRTCVVAALLREDAQPGPSRAWPPDLRHANTRAISECLDGLLGGCKEARARLLYRVFDTASERADVAMLDLLEWHVHAALFEDNTLQTVLIPERAAVRGEGALPPVRVDGDDVARIMLRAAALAASLGLPAPSPLAVRVVTYGVPHTPWAQALLRTVAVTLLAMGEGGLDQRFIAASAAPSAALLARVRAVTALVAQGDLHAYSIAEAKVWFDRQGGLGGRVGGVLARCALDLAWRGAPEADHVPRHAAALRRTLGVIDGVLDARAGDYEAPEEILARVFDPGPEGAVSRAQALLGRGTFALAAALAQRALVANHRGDAEVARNALEAALSAASGEESLRAVILRLECHTSLAIAFEDQWPYPLPGEDAVADLRAAEQQLHGAVEEFRRLLETLPVSERLPPQARARINLGDLGSEPVSMRQDPTLGAALGALGRVQALLGDHAVAAQTFLDARALFSPELDLAMNAAFLAHLELDLGAAADAARLAHIMATYVAPDARSPGHALARLRAHDDGFRFAMDLILKALAFGLPLEGAHAADWRKALCEDELYEHLALQQSHPTEQLARHAGELLQRMGDEAAAQRWFALSVQVADAGGAAMQRSAVFTRLLAQHGAQAATGPRGCLTNPCYAHR